MPRCHSGPKMPHTTDSSRTLVKPSKFTQPADLQTLVKICVFSSQSQSHHYFLVGLSGALRFLKPLWAFLPSHQPPVLLLSCLQYARSSFHPSSSRWDWLPMTMHLPKLKPIYP